MEKISILQRIKSNAKKTLQTLTLFSVLLLPACQETKSVDTDIDTNKITEVVKGKVIPETREYKLYKLDLNSIVPIKGDISKARVKVDKTEKLKNLLTKDDLDFNNLLPMALKESMLEHSSTSGSNARGYMQLMDIAVKDVIKSYHLESLKLDKEDPVDNIILGALYRKLMIDRLSKQLDGLNIKFSDTEKKNTMILIYNIGPTRTIDLLKQSKAKDYDSFISFLRKHIGIKKGPVSRFDNTYKINYTDLLGEKTISDFQGSSREYKKIAEGLRYLSVINGIDDYLSASSDMEIIGEIVSNKDNTLFSQVLKLRNDGVFLPSAPINDICKIILETNGYNEHRSPEWATFILIKDALLPYIQNVH